MVLTSSPKHGIITIVNVKKKNYINILTGTMLKKNIYPKQGINVVNYKNMKNKI